MTGRKRRRVLRFLTRCFWAYADGSGALLYMSGLRGPAPVAGAPQALTPVPDWHPERIVPLCDLPAAEQRWWRELEEGLS